MGRCGQALAMSETVYSQEATDVRAFVARIDEGLRLDEATLAKTAAEVLDAYASRLKSRDVPPATVRPARYAMAVVIDNAVRGLPSIQSSAWHASAHAHVFERRVISVDDLGQFEETARKEGGDFTPLASFLKDVIAEIETDRQSRASLSRGPALLFGLGVLGFLISLAGYAAFLDYRYHADLLDAFETRFESLPQDKSPERLASVAQLHGEVARASAAAPLSRAALAATVRPT